MSLSSLTESFVDQSALSSVQSTSAFSNLYAIVQNEGRTAALLPLLYWQIALRSEFFQQAITRTFKPDKTTEPFVVLRGTRDAMRSDLVLLQTRPIKPESVDDVSRMFEFGNFQTAYRGAVRWSEQRRSELKNRSAGDLERGALLTQLIEHLSPDDLAKLSDELSKTMRFGVVSVPRPPAVVATAALPAGAAVSVGGDNEPIATAGVVARRTGELGITTALHAVKAPIRRAHAAISLRVHDLDGKVVASNEIHDACFVSVPGLERHPWPKLNRGPLCGLAPRPREPVTFNGAVSGSQAAVVDAMSPEIPFTTALSQLKVLTDPVTSPGDSGAALLDKDSNVLGFAFERTGIGMRNGYSSWIWADSVFQSLKLVPITAGVA